MGCWILGQRNLRTKEEVGRCEEERLCGGRPYWWQNLIDGEGQDPWQNLCRKR